MFAESAVAPRRVQTDRSRRRRTLVWLGSPILALGAFGLALAVAALLNISSPSLGSATVVVAACDGNGLTATPNVSYSNGSYVVDSVSLAGLANGCRNQDYTVGLVGTTGLIAETVLTNVPVSSFGGTTNANTLSIDFTTASPRVAADAVTAIHVAISN